MTGAAAHEGEHLAEGLIAGAAEGWLATRSGPRAGWQAAKDAGKTGAKDQIFIGDISKLHAVDSWPLG